ncbi:MAG TPA: hypothetical protein VJT09_16820 [Pyrinomonadaceae bacterium]|nr:hypothetical protein [Pyrinomonadaceae bacterium]
MPEKRAVGFDVQGQPYDETGQRIHSRRDRRKEPPRIDKAISTIFTGTAFLVITIILAFTRMGFGWWYWMLIPAFSLLGGGISEYVRYKQSDRNRVELPVEESRGALPPTPARVSAIPPRNTSELAQPPSVTEGTTRHLDLSSEAAPRPSGTRTEKPASDI